MLKEDLKVILKECTFIPGGLIFNNKKFFSLKEFSEFINLNFFGNRIKPSIITYHIYNYINLYYLQSVSFKSTLNERLQ